MPAGTLSKRLRLSSTSGACIHVHLRYLSPVWLHIAHTGVFDAARYGIDRLKEIVLVWKKEIGSNGEEWVEGTYLLAEGE